jgi:hypothetical protein
MEQRSYSGLSHRPTPLITFESETKSLLVLTNWGEQSSAQRVSEILKDFLVTSSSPDATRIGPMQQGSPTGDLLQRLRAAVALGNESILLNENKTEWSSAVELAVLTSHSQVISWAQVGAPHVLLWTPEKNFQPLCYTPDWAWQIQQGAPLVCQALGLEKFCPVNSGSFRLKGNETLVLISRSHLPGTFFSSKNCDLQHLSRLLIEDSEETPFWIATMPANSLF